jgi:hypothetical protein
MKLSKLLRAVSTKLHPKPMTSKSTHDAYCEQVFNEAEGTYTGRVYDYKTGKVLEEYSGKGGRKAAGNHGKRIIKKYKKGT